MPNTNKALSLLAAGPVLAASFDQLSPRKSGMGGEIKWTRFSNGSGFFTTITE
jgi:hypothetical protein